MKINYEEAISLFLKYLNSQITSAQGKLKNIDYYSKVKEAYEDIKSRDYSKFVLHYDLLSKINENIKDSLNVICHFINHNIGADFQINEKIDQILNDKTLLKIVSNTDSKEMLEGKVEKLSSIVDGNYDFETFKNALLDSGLDDEVIICILTYEAEKSIKKEKKETTSLNQNNDINESIVKKYEETLKKVNDLIDRNYYLVESLSSYNEVFKKILQNTDIRKINEIYSEKNYRACLNILKLIDIRNEGKEIYESKPIDYELLDYNTRELEEEYNYALIAIKEYEEETKQDVPIESNIFFLLDEDKPLFNIEELNEEDKKNLKFILDFLELGLLDVNARNKSIVKQTVRKDLNLFIRRKENIAVSYIRVNSKNLEKGKILALIVSEYKNIYDESTSLLRSKGQLIDEAISKIKNNDPEFIKEASELNNQLNEMLPSGEVTLS